MKKKTFLKTVCPFRALEEKVTWGEFIVLQIKGILGVTVFFAYYIFSMILADIVRVAG